MKTTIRGAERVGKNYIARCINSLKRIGAPLEGWECISCEDNGDDSFKCELCGFSRVRYIHEMVHDDFPDIIRVGCKCAGVMEGDIIAAEERERRARNRAGREKRFMRQKSWIWNNHFGGFYQRDYKDDVYWIKPSGDGCQYAVWYKDKWCWKCCGKPITSFSQAAWALYRTIDPPEDVCNARA